MYNESNGGNLSSEVFTYEPEKVEVQVMGSCYTVTECILGLQQEPC